MSLAYAASQSGEHSAEPNVGDVILHHVLDTKILSIKILGIDLSITKHVLMMWIAAALIIVIFRYAFRQHHAIPTGIANFLEAIVVFLRDEVILPTMGEEGKPYLPYLLTVFFFILFCNLLGLVPFGATATGNVSVTAALALMAFIMIQAGGIRKYGLKHHLQNIIPPGMPVWLLPIMIPVEIMGQFTIGCLKVASRAQFSCPGFGPRYPPTTPQYLGQWMGFSAGVSLRYPSAFTCKVHHAAHRSILEDHVYLTPIRPPWIQARGEKS